MKLSISCRRGSTSLVLGSPAGLPAGDRYVVWYTIDSGPAKGCPHHRPQAGTGFER